MYAIFYQVPMLPVDQRVVQVPVDVLYGHGYFSLVKGLLGLKFDILLLYCYCSETWYF